jgi:hypothetical protein
LPIFARDVFEVGPWGLGILRAAPAVLIGGLGILAVVVVWAKVFPALYRVERFPST